MIFIWQLYDLRLKPKSSQYEDSLSCIFITKNREIIEYINTIERRIIHPNEFAIKNAIMFINILANDDIDPITDIFRAIESESPLTIVLYAITATVHSALVKLSIVAVMKRKYILFPMRYCNRNVAATSICIIDPIKSVLYTLNFLIENDAIIAPIVAKMIHQILPSEAISILENPISKYKMLLIACRDESHNL